MKGPLDRPVLRDQVREFLAEAILSGIYPAGERVVETRVAKELGVSQGAVREALRELEWMGFLETRPFSGSTVKALSARDFLDIYPVRSTLEALGARLALPHLTDSDLDALGKLVDEMVYFSRKDDERRMVERDYSFHQTIIQASRNSALIRTWSVLRFSCWTSVTTARLHEDLVFLAERHYPVLNALRTRDPEQASQAMQSHLIELMEKLSRSDNR